jgi:diguanylate cyclase (GGDEF)-like protein
MISIKKLIERNGEELLAAAIESYRASLNVVGESSVQACPPVGAVLRQNLLNLQAALSAQATADHLQETGRKVEAELTRWGSDAADYFRQRSSEVKELMLILARTAELTGERDQRYSRQFQEFTGRLEAMGDMHDLVLIRDSLVQSASDLRVFAEAMAEESQQSVEQLRQDLNGYQARLDDAERLAGQDSLTGLENRRRVEASIENRIERREAFSVLLLDLNGFKQLNDTCGHLAADEVLKQFTTELKSGFRSSDVVGRWGGDEFIVVLDAGIEEANAHVERIARWVFGDYTVHVGEESRKVPLSAAVGIAGYRTGDTLRTLLDRADAAMYRNKRGGAQPKT